MPRRCREPFVGLGPWFALCASTRSAIGERRSRRGKARTKGPAEILEDDNGEA